ARPVAGLLRHEPRRPGAQDLLGHPPALRDPVEGEPHLLPVRRRVRRLRPGRHRGRHDQHRDAVRVHPGLRRRLDPARPAPRAAARLPRAAGAAVPDPGDHRMRGDDPGARLAELAAPGGLAGGRARYLCRLRAEALEAPRRGLSTAAVCELPDADADAEAMTGGMPKVARSTRPGSVADMRQRRTVCTTQSPASSSSAEPAARPTEPGSPFGSMYM